MNLSRDVVAKVAKLARIRLTDAEEESYAAELGDILSYVEQLQKVDVDGIEPLAHCLPLDNAFRADENRPSLTADDALANAARATIVSFIRRAFPAGTANAYTPIELAMLNRRRNCRRPFDPYAAPASDRRPDAGAEPH